MITLMKLERSLSSKQLVRSCAAASCPAQQCSRAQRPAPSTAPATGSPASGVTRREVAALGGLGGSPQGVDGPFGQGTWQSLGPMSRAAS